METEIERYEAEIKQCKERIKTEPKDLEAYQKWLSAIEMLNLPEDELKEYGKAIEANLDSAQAYNDFAVLLARFDRNDQAIEYFNKTRQKDPQFNINYNYWGIVLYNLEKHEEAIEKYKKAVDLNPLDVYPYYNWGLALYRLERYKEAISLYKKAIEISPDYAPAYNNWGLTLEKLDRPEEAIEKYREATIKDPDYARAYNNCGMALYDQGEDKEAVEQFEKTLEKDPHFAINYNTWGIALYNLGRHEEAIEKYRKAAELDPADFYPYYNWGLALYKSARYEEAIEQYQKAVEINPEFDDAYYNLGSAHERLAKYEEASRYYQIANKINPDSADTYNGWGLALEGQGKYEEAIEKYKIAATKDPTYVYAYNNWGLSLDKLGRFEQAIEQYDEALKHDPDYKYAYFNKALALEKLCRFEEAIEEYSKTFTIDPDYAYPAHNIANIYERLGYIEKSATWWLKALESYKRGTVPAKQQRDAAYFYYYAQVYHYEFRINFEKAKSIYTEGLRIDPNNSTLLIGLAKLFNELKEEDIEFTGKKPLIEIKSEGHWKSREYLYRLKNILEKNLSDTPDDLTLFELGELYHLLGENYFDQAIDCLTELQRRSQHIPRTAEILGRIYLSREEYQKSISCFQQERQISPDNLNVRSMLADAYLKAKIRDKAEHLYKEIIDINQNHLDALLGIGELHIQKGERYIQDKELGFAEENFRQAIDYYSRAFDVDKIYRAYLGYGLSKKEMAVAIYSQAYARVKLYESQQNRDKEPSLLIEANKAFTRIKEHYQGTQNYYRADTAKKRIAERLKPDRDNTTRFGAKAVFYFSCFIFLITQFLFIFGQPTFSSTYIVNENELEKILSAGEKQNIRIDSDLEKLFGNLTGRRFSSYENFIVIVSKEFEVLSENKKDTSYQEIFKYLLTEIAAKNVLKKEGGIRAIGLIRTLTPPYYALLTFGSLIFMVAGLYIRETTRFKVGAIELEKSPSEQLVTSGSLGISRGISSTSVKRRS